MNSAHSHEIERNIYRESLLRRALERTDATAYNPFPTTFKVVNNQAMATKVGVILIRAVKVALITTKVIKADSITKVQVIRAGSTVIKAQVTNLISPISLVMRQVSLINQ